MCTAREVQAGLLPRRSPRLETLACAGVTCPAEGLGGDWFDFLKPSPRRLAIALGDISGKSVPAALMSASLQATLRAHYALGGGDLAARLESINRLFHECTASGHFASLFLGEYDDRNRRLRYANCGHVPPLLLRADGEPEWLASTATLLGILPDWRCAIAETTLSAGDTLLLYSDGATEARNPAGEEYGEQRLAASFHAARRMPLPALLEVVAREVRMFTGGRMADDLTLVVAHPVSPPAPGRPFTRPERDEAARGGTGGIRADLHPSR
jgi:sigma-B regulation protein RsbU (phosphoserine phosphatase)